MKLAVETKIEAAAVEAAVGKMKKGEMSKGACIRELFAGGMEVKEIAAATGIRYNHVYNVVKNEVLVHGLEVEQSSRSNENSKKNQIIRLLGEGKSITQVATELKCLYNYVWQIAKGAGFTKSSQETQPVATDGTPVDEVVTASSDRPTTKKKAKVGA